MFHLRLRFALPRAGLAAVVLAAALAAAASPSSLAAAEPAPSVWRTDVNSAWQTTKASGRPLLLFVTSESCHYCRRMKHETYSDAGVLADLEQSFEPAVVDAARQPDLARRLGVSAYPTTVIVGPDGSVLDSIRGFVGPTELRRRLASLRSQDQLSGR